MCAVARITAGGMASAIAAISDEGAGALPLQEVRRPSASRVPGVVVAMHGPGQPTPGGRGGGGAIAACFPSPAQSIGSAPSDRASASGTRGAAGPEGGGAEASIDADGAPPDVGAAAQLAGGGGGAVSAGGSRSPPAPVCHPLESCVAAA